MQNVLQVKVTNKNKFTIEDMFDGILYEFEPDRPVSVPYEAACHIFGIDFAPTAEGTIDPNLRDVAFKHLQRRWGWNRTDKLKEARANFDRIGFSLSHMVMVEKEITEELPEPVAPKAFGRSKKEVA